MSTSETFNIARVVLAGSAIAAVAGTLWLAGVQHQTTLVEGNHPREAFAALKRAAGPRMQVRKVDISPTEMSVHARDPDMPEWRWVPNTRRRSGFGHWYDAGSVKEQSWRVSYWTVFGHDWYRVRGPIAEAIIQQDDGPTFDLNPEDFIEMAELSRK